ncbi:hypothetical protein [Ursidibacter sp. B-7004-1]
MKTSKKFLFLFIISFLTSNSLATDKTEITRYTTARVEIDYSGHIGDFLQQLAYKLNIAYYNYQADPLLKISVYQDNNASLQDLINSINKQMDKQKVIIDLMNDKPTLALVNKNVKSLIAPQFIGDFDFSKNLENNKENSEKNINQLENLETSAIHPQSEDNKKPEENNLNDKEKYIQEQESKMKKFVLLSQDEKLIAKYKRKAPLYTVNNKEIIQLDNIRSTKLNTFLVFEHNINVEDYQIDGNFEDIAKLGNIVAILHRKKSPPKSITITTKNNQKVEIIKTN